jgi:hypothetical protein
MKQGLRIYSLDVSPVSELRKRTALFPEPCSLLPSTRLNIGRYQRGNTNCA